MCKYLCVCHITRSFHRSCSSAITFNIVVSYRWRCSVVTFFYVGAFVCERTVVFLSVSHRSLHRYFPYNRHCSIVDRCCCRFRLLFYFAFWQNVFPFRLLLNHPPYEISSTATSTTTPNNNTNNSSNEKTHQIWIYITMRIIRISFDIYREMSELSMHSHVMTVLCM